MDDIENEDDLQELEAQLYSQVHHESGQEEFILPDRRSPLSTRSVTKTSVINAKVGSGVSRGRYWTDNGTPIKMELEESVSGNNSGGGRASSVAANVDALVQSLREKSIGRQQSSTGIILIPASGGDPEKKRSQITQNKSKVQRPPLVDTSRSFLCEKIMKLDRKKKLHSKQLKAKKARQKQKARLSTVVETIQVDSSSSGDDEIDEDVMVVPVPPPPMVVIDSSDDEQKAELNSFVKPNDLNAEQKSSKNSRGNSPSSVVSDDFIAQLDNSRLLKEVSATNDDDMQCIEDETRADEASKVGDASNFATPEKRVSKRSKHNESTYEVTQANFRAVDVYESESSDMLESVYAKRKPGVESSNEIYMSSSSDVEEVEVVTNKTKKLRKRKPSGSNKGSEPNDDSTDSEGAVASDTLLPYISRGEAVENCKQKTKRRPTSNRGVVNSSDNEFINKLSNIARGKDESQESNESADETITARHIAEDVLNQNANQAIVVEEPAIPNQAIKDLDNVLGLIDKMNTSYDDYEEPPRHGRDESPSEKAELFFEELLPEEKASKSIKTKKTTNATKASEIESFVSTVYSNREHVAWTDEMVRFYENSWGQERFNVDRILRMMDRSANWRIRNDDRFPRVRKFSNIKCNNCCEFGHPRVKCPQPTKDLICNVCGDIGHREPRCPNTLCFRCGRKSNTFTRSCNFCIDQNRLICPICKIRGHGIDLCPDKWRRYHSTTDVNAHPNQTVFYNEKKFCCICAGFGHLPERCKSSNKLLEYHTPLSDIRSHANSYDDIQLKKGVVPGVVGVNLMCEPSDKIEFPFTSKVTKDQYYGRFLSAVGLYKQGGKKRSSTGAISDDSIKKMKNYVLNPFAKKVKKSTSDEVTKDVEQSVKALDAEVIEVNTSEPTVADEDPIFKAPKDMAETTLVLSENKSESIAEKSSEEITTESSKDKSTEEIAAADSDSNYSFSEHFSQAENIEDPPTKSTTRVVGPLPDFIPINDSDDEMNEEESASDAPKGPISGAKQNVIALEENTDEVVDESEDVCEGKIYLSKFHSKLLLSAAGSKFIVKNAKKYDLKARMNWNTAGNVLIIKGRTGNQDKFHTELMTEITNLSVELNRKELEQSQKIPRKRAAIIKFLQEDILQLAENIGNVRDLQKRIQQNQKQMSRTNFKITERSRRLLNMILMGQAGLREGRMHLEALQAKLKELQDIDIQQVSDEVRDEISGHWKYIFSSYKHEHYDLLIQQYGALKKVDKMPTLNYRLLGKKVLDTSFTDKEMGKLITPIAKSTPLKNSVAPENENSANLTSNIPKMVINPLSRPPDTPRTEYGARQVQQQYRQEQRHRQEQSQQFNSPRQQYHQRQFHQPQQPRGVWQSQQLQPQFGSNAGSFVSNQNREINPKWGNQNDNTFNHTGQTPNLTQKQASAASSYWSRECRNYIDRCMNICKADQITEKLNMLSERAARNLLSYNDFNELKRIYFTIMKR